MADDQLIQPDEAANPFKQRKRALLLEKYNLEAALIAPEAGRDTKAAESRIKEIDAGLAEVDKRIKELSA